jgi:hypothetical protein
MKITKRQLKRIIREEKQRLLRETADFPYAVKSPMSGEPARFRDLDAAIMTASVWERDGFLDRNGTSPEVLDALDLEAGRHPGGSIG